MVPADWDKQSIIPNNFIVLTFSFVFFSEMIDNNRGVYQKVSRFHLFISFPTSSIALISSSFQQEICSNFFLSINIFSLSFIKFSTITNNNIFNWFCQLTLKRPGILIVATDDAGRTNQNKRHTPQTTRYMIHNSGCTIKGKFFEITIEIPRLAPYRSRSGFGGIRQKKMGGCRLFFYWQKVFDSVKYKYRWVECTFKWINVWHYNK